MVCSTLPTAPSLVSVSSFLPSSQCPEVNERPCEGRAEVFPSEGPTQSGRSQSPSRFADVVRVCGTASAADLMHKKYDHIFNFSS